MPKPPDPSRCAPCKGYRLLCGRRRCPILLKFESQRTVCVSDSFSGATPPEVLVGSRTWPELMLGPLASPVDVELAEEMGDPARLYGKSLEEVIELRSRLIRCVVKLNVRSARNPPRILEQIREAALSCRGLPVEVELTKAPVPKLHFDGFLLPSGPLAELRDLRFSNPVVPPSVERAIGDTDVKAETAMREMYESGLSSYYIARLLSLGMLGRRRERLLVPSRWAITAVDSSLSKFLSSKIRGENEIQEIEVFTTEYVGNRYAVLFFPSALSYEMVEIVHPGCVYMPEAPSPWVGSDSEGWASRGSYPSIGGGYYAAKLPVYEYLALRRRQAFALVVREVTPEYWAPVGSWKIREALRNAFREKPRRFSSVEEALSHVSGFISLPLEEWLPKARRFMWLRNQRKLG